MALANVAKCIFPAVTTLLLTLLRRNEGGDGAEDYIKPIINSSSARLRWAELSFNYPDPAAPRSPVFNTELLLSCKLLCLSPVFGAVFIPRIRGVSADGKSRLQPKHPHTHSSICHNLYILFSMVVAYILLLSTDIFRMRM